MKKYILGLLLLLIPITALASVENPTEWTEQDGSPSVFEPYKIKVSNGTLTDNADGTISITTGGGGGGGTPGGSDTQVQFNDGGSFGGDAGLTYNKTTDALTVVGALAASNLSGTNTGDNATNSQYSGLVTMTYPGAGIALSTGSAWDTSITNNSANWNTAYGWGNHAVAGYVTGTPWTSVGYLTSEVDGSTTNEINTIQGDDNVATTGLAISIDGAGTVTTDVVGDVLTITGSAHSTRDSLGLDTDDTVTFANLSGTNTGNQDLSGLVPYTGASTSVDLGSQTATTTGTITGRTVSYSGAVSGTINSSAASSSASGVWKVLNGGTTPSPMYYVGDTLTQTLTNKNYGLSNGGALQTNTTTAHTGLIQAYDVDGAAYTTFGTLTNGNTPTFDLSTAVTVGSQPILVDSDISSTVQAYDADLTTWAGITPGTGVGTALAVNVGSAGAFVTNGGALGTPSSGNASNLTSFPTLNQNTTGYAEALKSATTTVSVSAATAPSSGQVLMATSSTTATWQTPATASGAPTGSITIWTTDTAPTGYLLCYGQAVSRTTYADLFAVVSTVYGTGDGSTTFNVPDMRGRIPLGQDDMGGSSANRVVAAAADTLGSSGGAETHTLTEAELAAHNHPFKVRTEAGDTGWADPTNKSLGRSSTGNIAYSSAVPGTTISDPTIGDAGSGNAHNNMQPYITLNYIIKT